MKRWIFILLFGCAAGCNFEKRLTETIVAPVEVMLVTNEISPDKRVVLKTWPLSQEGIDLLNALIHTSDPKHFGYVGSEYYLRLADGRIWGLVDQPASGDAVMVDISGGNALGQWVTSPHLLLENKDHALGARLMDAVKRDATLGDAQ